MNKSDALVVFSGGQDSTTCLFWAKKHFRKVYALSFIYGDRKSTRLNSSHKTESRMPSSA